ncbi:hypothetical protein B7R74_10015 [Yersinia pseudotuberculosis]|nr:hypothetical protein B7R74_10015 [Yersinia pseudotuberculosis]
MIAYVILYDSHIAIYHEIILSPVGHVSKTGYYSLTIGGDGSRDRYEILQLTHIKMRCAG